jgi:hypothetical protein
MLLGLESPFDKSFLGSDLVQRHQLAAIRTAVGRAPSSRSLRASSTSCANAGCSSSYWARSSGMKRCCDIRLPFKRKRQRSFATSSS